MTYSHILPLSKKFLSNTVYFLPPYNKDSDFILIFDCWQISNPSTSLSITALHLGKLIRKLSYSFLREAEVQINQAPAHMWKPASQFTPTYKKSNQSNLCTLSSHVLDFLRAHPALPRKTHSVASRYVWVTSLVLTFKLNFGWGGPSCFYVVITTHLHFWSKTSLLPWLKQAQKFLT